LAEVWVATLEGRADRQATAAKTNRYSLLAAHWSAVFEAILLLDIALIVHSGFIVAAAIVAGAWLGKYIAVEQRRRRFRTKGLNRRSRRARPAQE
jgi:predicted hydrolase (HD superfamily)